MFLLQPTLLLVFYGLPYYFSTVWRATSTIVYCNASVYTVSLRVHYVRKFAFKFFKIICRYATWSRTWNMFFFLVVWQEFKSPSYEWFFFIFLWQHINMSNSDVKSIDTYQYFLESISIDAFLWYRYPYRYL